MTKSTVETIFTAVNFLIMLGTMFLIFSSFSDVVKIVLVTTAFLAVNILGFAEGRYSKTHEIKE